MCVITVIIFYSVPLIALFIDSGANTALCYTTRKQEGAFGNLRVSPVSRSWCFEVHTGESETQYFKRSVYTHIYTYGLLNIDMLGDRSL